MSNSILKFRHWCYTFNNYPNTVLVDSIPCAYIIYGFEVGDSGTPHLQGFISFQSQKTQSAVIKLMPGCHIEQMLSNVEACIEYCKKDGKFVERGVVPKSLGTHNKKQQEDWAQILVAAKERRLEDVPPEIRLKYCRNLDYIADQEDRFRVHASLDVLQNEWRYGATGSGKTRSVEEEFPLHYKKMCNKWWDGYMGEEVVLIDEFNKEAAKYLAHHLKLWCDHYPFRAEKKGGSIVIRPKRIIVTSNYSLADCFSEDTEGSLDPLKRRFKEHHYSNLISKKQKIDYIAPNLEYQKH